MRVGRLGARELLDLDRDDAAEHRGGERDQRARG